MARWAPKRYKFILELIVPHSILVNKICRVPKGLLVSLVLGLARPEMFSVGDYLTVR